MDAGTLNTISIVAFVLAAIFFVIAVVLFFVFDIPSVWGELSGKTAAKQVAEIRAANRNVTSRRRVASDEKVRKTGKTGNTSTMQARQASRTQAVNYVPETDLLVEETALLTEETALLTEETALLTEETTVLGGETTLLSPFMETVDEGTTLLAEDKQLADNFVVIQNVVIVHTNEKI